MTNPVRCCIVGGGPAGMMAGVLLARAGIRVVVLEKHADFLRDFRGDTVHPSTMDVIAELGWLDELLRIPHQELSRIRAHIGDTEITLADFTHAPTQKKFIALMPQWEFLSFLAEKARAYPEFDLRMRAEVIGLVEETGTVKGVRVRTPEGESELRADLVIAADGRSSIVREQAGLVVHDVGAPMDVLWMRLPRREEDPNDSLGWVQRGRFLALINRGDYWQIAYLIEKGGFAAWKERGIDAFRKDVAVTTPFLADRVGLIGSFDDVKLLVVKVDRLEQWWRSGLLCIGDSAHAMSPIGGVGINIAIQDAVAAANLLAEPLRNGPVSDAILAKVQRRREWAARVTQTVQVAIQNRIIGRVLSNAPIHLNPALRLINRVPWLQRLPAYAVGVGVRPEHVASRSAPNVSL